MVCAMRWVQSASGDSSDQNSRSALLLLCVKATILSKAAATGVLHGSIGTR